MFEVLGAVTPFGAASKVDKAAALTTVLNKPFIRGKLAPATRVEMDDFTGAIRASTMCFVAGTPVLTKHGLKKIEDVKAGVDVVWSRDELTMAEDWRPVIATFVTHPTEIYRLTYSVRGPPSVVPGKSEPATGHLETLGVTGPHPFWVCNRPVPGFVTADWLIPGDILSLADGGTAEVIHNAVEQAPAGTSLTTYNFEVADFHTYFAGNASVWVHNFSNRLCPEAYNVFKAVQDKWHISDAALPGKRFDIVQEAWRISGPMPGNGPGHVLHVLQRDEFADFAAGRIGLDKLKSVREQKALLAGKGAGDLYHIHHASETWLSRICGVPEHLLDEVPGIALPNSPRTFAPHVQNYRETFGHEPIYHKGTYAEGSLVERLAEIRRRFANGELTPETILGEVKSLYLTPPYSNAQMWPVARDWLRANATRPDLIIPD